MHESLLDRLARAGRASGRARDGQVPGRPHLRRLAGDGQELRPSDAPNGLPRRQADPRPAPGDPPRAGRRPGRPVARHPRRQPGGAGRGVEGEPARGGQRGHDGARDPAGPLDAKKKTLGAAERDPVARAAWRNEVAPPLDPKRLVAVDEMASTVALTRLYGYAPHDERCHGSVPKNYDRATSLVAALRLDGMPAAMTRLGAIATAA